MAAAPPVTAAGEESDKEQNLTSAVERYRARYFSGFDKALPPFATSTSG